MRIEDELKELLSKAVKKGYDYDLNPEQIVIEKPKRKEQGDFSSNTAMQLARVLKANPRQIASVIVENLDKDGSDIDHVEIAGPGFLNFFVKSDRYSKLIEKIRQKKDEYGQLEPNGIKVDLEYVSANPTGSLHLGHARGAAWGDSVARIMKKAGYDVTREYYVNDAGNQIHNLALSLWARYREALGIPTEIGPDGYLGADIKEKGIELAKEFKDAYIDESEENLKRFARIGVEFELDKIRKDLKDYRVSFDVWSSEQKIRDDGKVDAVLKKLDEEGYLYEQDGAIWFKSTEFGDDKDRVLKKQDGSYTYLVPDIAYHNDKYERGFDTLVDFFGADHHGYITRLKGTMKALGNDPDKLNVDIIQMVRLVSNGEEIVMSKRKGNATTIAELVEWVGPDAARYFFVSRALDSHLDFDVELARKQASDNPVYYAQYAHARMNSILKSAQAKGIKPADHYELLTDEKELELLGILEEFEKVIADTARTRSVHKITHYIQNLASHFHSFYTKCKVIDEENPELSAQRLALIEAAKITLANALDLIGVEAVDSM